MLQHGIAGPDDEYDVDEYFREQKDLYIHLESTACEDWVVEDNPGELRDWARPI